MDVFKLLMSFAIEEDLLELLSELEPSLPSVSKAKFKLFDFMITPDQNMHRGFAEKGYQLKLSYCYKIIRFFIEGLPKRSCYYLNKVGHDKLQEITKILLNLHYAIRQ